MVFALLQGMYFRCAAQLLADEIERKMLDQHPVMLDIRYPSDGVGELRPVEGVVPVEGPFVEEYAT